MLMRYTLIIALCCLTGSAFAQTMQTGFGKNRVQYHKQMEEWLYYETPHFITYWYGDARSIAHSALQMAEVDFEPIQQLLEHQLTDRIELLVFSDVTDLKQSNIGSEELFLLRSGQTKVMGNKVFVYFDGNHNHLRAQVREGVAGVVLNSMLYGANLQEIVQNAVLLNLPAWYTDGLTAYCGEAWNPELDQQMRDLLATGKFTTFDKLVRKHPQLAGHAFWYYIAQHFGANNISNLLYLTRINRGLDAGFRYVLGNGYDRTTAAMLEFYNNRYADESRFLRKPAETKPVKIKNKRNLPLSQYTISPDGKRIAWVSNDIGKWRVWEQDLQTGKRRRLLKGGVRNQLQATDYAYPLLTWHPDNQRLAILYERRDVAKLALIDTKTGKNETKPISPEFQRVYNMDFINGIDLVFSAAVRGYTDLYIYHTVNRQTERLTQDMWDDLDVKYAILEGRRSLIFASNRVVDTLANEKLDSILPVGKFDLFLYDLESRSPELIRLTNTAIADERQPVLVDSTHFAYLTDENGIFNRSAGMLEDYTAYYKTTFYLKNGGSASALDTRQIGEWPLAKALLLLAPADTVRRYLDSTQIDSIRTIPVFKKRAVTWSLTNYDRNIVSHDITTARSGKMAEAIRREDKMQFFIHPIPDITRPTGERTNPSTRYREATLRSAGVPIPKATDPLPEPVQKEVIKPRADSVVIQPGWLFQVPKYLQSAPSTPVIPKSTTPKPIIREEDEVEDNLGARPIEPDRYTDWLAQKPKFETGIIQKNTEIVRFSPSKIVPYRLKFRTDFVSTSMDNNLLFDGLDSYAGSPAGFRTPPPGVLLRANFKELLENYVIEAGFRLPTSFNGAEYYLWMEDRKRRIDRRYAVYRKTTVNTLEDGLPGLPVGQPYQIRTNTILGQYELRYPIDPFFSLRGMATLRQDKKMTLTTERATLEQPDYAEQRAALRFSLVYDNTLDVDLNIKNGTRARLYIESVKRFDLNTQPKWSLKLNSGFMTVVHLDARHYQRLDRRSILAVRLAAATTFGSERILYYLGGVDNWLLPKFDNSIAVPQDQAFAYQTSAANLRGFKQNIRNGNSFALINSELRIPIFKYLSNKPTLGSFWRNFQVVGFFDAGTAWVGPNPYSGNNPLNIVYIENPPTVFVKVNYFRDPLVAGYGLGLRVPVFGMYLRADYAWGIETRVIQKPLLHLALGADF